MDEAQEIEQIKRELLNLIIDHLKNNKLSLEDAQKQAKDFLAVLPIANYQDLLAKLKILGETYKEAQEVYVEEFGKASDQKDKEVLNNMRDAIAQGNIDQALTHAKLLQGGQN